MMNVTPGRNCGLGRLKMLCNYSSRQDSEEAFSGRSHECERGTPRACATLVELDAAGDALRFRLRFGVISGDLGRLLGAAGEFAGGVAHLDMAGIRDFE